MGDPAGQVEAVLSAWIEKRESGGAPTPRELVESHPEIAELLRERLAVLSLLDRAFEDVVYAPSAQHLGPYRILRQIGRGGMGTVYEAIHEPMQRHVALKVLHAPGLHQERSVERFRREARAAGKLKHPNIATMHDLGSLDGTWYCAMELVPGQALDDIVAGLAGGTSAKALGVALGAEPRSPGWYRAWAGAFSGVAKGLELAHQHDVVHRDVKPGNLMLTPDGDLKLLDFGLARLGEGEAGITVTGDVLGTPLYMSPEQARGRQDEVGPRTDIYSLAATLYEVLTFRPPHRGDTPQEATFEILHRDPVAIRQLDPRVPRDLETVVAKALEKDPGRRYETAEDMAEDLDRVARGAPVRARPVGPLGRTWRRVRRHPVRAALLVLLLLALGGASVLARDLGRAEEVLTDEQARRRDLEYEGLLAGAHRALRNAGPPWGDALELSTFGMFTRRPEEGTAEEAVSRDLFSQAIKLLPDRHEAYLERSLCWSRTQREAYADLEAARTRGLPESTYHLARAYMLRQEGLDEEAVAEAAKSTSASDSLSPTASFLLAALDVARGDPSRSERLLGRAIDDAPHVSVTAFLARRMRGLLRWRRGDNAGALADQLTVRELGDRTYETSVRIAKSWWNLGEHERAREIRPKLMASARQRGADGFVMLASACSRCWNWGWGILAAQEGIDTYGENVALSVLRAEAFLHLDRPAAALKEIDLLLAGRDDANQGPQGPDLHALRADALLFLERPEEALTEARLAIKSRPRDFDAVLALAKALNAVKQHADAIKSADIVIAHYPMEYEGYDIKAVSLGELERRTESVAAYDLAIERYAENAHLHRNRAWQLWRVPDFEGAEAGFRKAIELDPKYVNAMACLGAVLTDLDRDEEALVVLERAVALDDSAVAARGNLGGALFRLGKAAEAEPHIRFALANEPTSVVWQETLGGVLRDTGRPVEALDALAAALPLTPDNDYKARIHGHRARILRRLGKLDDALVEAVKGVRLAPDQPLSHETLAATFRAMGRLDEALDAIDRGIDVAADPLTLRGVRAMLLNLAGRPADALEEGWAVMAAGGGDVNIRTTILFRLAARPDDTAERYVQGLAWAAELGSPDDPKAGGSSWLVHGALAYRTSQFDLAIASLDRAIATEERRLEVGCSAFLAMSYARKGKRKSARRWLRRAEAAHAELTQGNAEYEALIQEAAATVRGAAR